MISIRVAMAGQEVERRLRLFETLCREQGVTLTVQRRDILEAVIERDDHPTADQVYESAKDRIPGLSRTTVYRVLETLVSLGLVRRLHHTGTSTRFDGKIDRHHHLVCRECERVVDITSRNLDNLQLPSNRRHGFRIEDYTIQFLGICKDCRRDVGP